MPCSPQHAAVLVASTWRADSAYRSRTWSWICWVMDAPSSGDLDQAGEARADARPATREIGGEGVVDEGAAPLANNGASLTQDLQVVADGGLADRAALGEVTGAHGSGSRCELPQDREADWISDGLQQLDVGVCI